ncbi:MAG: bifunctional phosphoribosylaminoimidazolecarboxamide formyltransferase/IMP cyclohydrolase [Acidobacteriota bacterium]
MLPIQRALVSVSDKSGIADFARALAGLEIEIVSTGGTASALEAAGIPVTRVSDVTQHPEILDGRVKTLHPRIHGGILADRQRAGHLSELQEHGIPPIDLVVCNLYPFERTVAGDPSLGEAIEMIDIGGPTMIRAAAKNFRSVAVVVEPADYAQVLAALESGERQLGEGLRKGLAIKAFRHTQAYDAAISTWLEAQAAETENLFPRRRLLDLALVATTRYGENPHQPGAVYRSVGGPGVLGGYSQLQGRELSYNNLLDADAARRLVALFEEPTVVIVKHNNPCGIGRGETLADAYARALACDPTSAFGSILALNRTADREFAEAMRKLFAEVVVAPEIDEEAASLFANKKNLRVLRCPPLATGTSAAELELRAIDGGFLAQTPDLEADDSGGWTTLGAREPTDAERTALDMAWRAARGTKSNAIVLADAQATLGIGAGQMSRVDACHLAVRKAADAGLDLAGCAAASDAFFPFRDGVDVLAAAGVTAIVQPAGSKRDDEVIAAADEHDLAMVATGTRHFRH